MTITAHRDKFCTTDLVWDTTSPWSNPHPNSIYTSEVKLSDEDIGYDTYVSFHVWEMRLIFKEERYRFNEKEETVYYDLGEFVECLNNEIAVRRIKKYAGYVLEGFRNTWNLCHCPSYERVEDVDDNFNSTI